MLTSTLLNQNPITVAKYLLGKEIRSTIGGQMAAGIIIETEAYLSDGDAAAHNARGKTTANSSLYKDAGTLYPHQLRQHILLDIVVGPVGSPGSVLIPALHPTCGIETMQIRRRTNDLTKLCSGPGKLTADLGLTRALDGQSLFDPDCLLSISGMTKYQSNIAKESITTSPRIGITKNADAPLRFYLTITATD